MHALRCVVIRTFVFASVVIGTALIPSMSCAEIIVEQLTIEQPRAFGYHIGDKYGRTIELQLRKPYKLEARSLPAAGRLSEWLAVDAVRLEQRELGASTHYVIRLTYQIVNINLEVLSIPVPHIDLAYGDGKETLKTLVPATRIGASMLADPAGYELQADAVPLILPYRIAHIAITACVFAAAIAGLIVLRRGVPFANARRPFGALYRSLRKSRKQDWDDAHYRAALHAVHAAFNDTAGRTVFADGLPGFFREQPGFARIETSITDYFAHSQAYFFAHADDVRGERYTRADLLTFVNACRGIERGLS
jgi:mxaA protein